MVKKHKKTETKQLNYAESERGIIRKSWKKKIRVALIYPNIYPVAISNLGFQSIYLLLNRMENVVCERAFLPDISAATPSSIFTIESGHNIIDFDIIAFSISFESDYLNILNILNISGLPLLSEDRDNSHPFVIAGGVACFINPEPIAVFIDLFIIGEGECLANKFFEKLDFSCKKEMMLEIVRNIDAVYVPSFYDVKYNLDRTILSFTPNQDIPVKVKRNYVKKIDTIETTSTILTPNTIFNNTYLIETGRGCPHGCRFCSAGFIYRPPRLRSVENLKKSVEKGLQYTNKIGLVGAAVSDVPDLCSLCSEKEYKGIDKKIKFSFSSLRADSLDPDLCSLLANSGVKTATIAPDAGSERLRRVINKHLAENQILNAVTNLVKSGVINLKLYFMIGLPTENQNDIDAIINLCKAIKKVFLDLSKTKGKIGTITISINPFVPKPFTPFQWFGMESVKSLKKKMRYLGINLKKIPNVKVNPSSVKNAYIQGILSKGDRHTADFLYAVFKNRGNWTKTLKNHTPSPDFYVTRKYNYNEILPWDFIDNGISKSFLINEYEKAKKEKQSPACPVKSCTLCGVCKK